ncbi:hypothetical protein HDU82_007883 [Entophlyctis luteolus]|nr:hypothetical protein HDU82_007883 [Entophlyctis luteolus]
MTTQPSDDAATDRESDGSNGRLSVADDCSVDSDGFDDACARSDPALAGYQLLDDDYDPGSDKDNEDDADEVDADDRDEQLPPRPVLVAKQSDLLSNDNVDTIKSIMSSIMIPSSAIPDWAKSIPEVLWLPKVEVLDFGSLPKVHPDSKKTSESLPQNMKDTTDSVDQEEKSQQ